MENLVVKGEIASSSVDSSATLQAPRSGKHRPTATSGKSSSLFSNKSLSTLRKLLGQQPEVERIVSKRIRSQSADVSELRSKEGHLPPAHHHGVVVRHGLRLRVQPQSKRSPLLRSPLIGKILESVSDMYEERCIRTSGVVQRSSRSVMQGISSKASQEHGY